MGTSINIDESIRELTKWRKELNYDNGDYCYGGDITRYSLDVAINIMRKYQEIEKIVEDSKYKPPLATLNELIMVVEEWDYYKKKLALIPTED